MGLCKMFRILSVVATSDSDASGFFAASDDRFPAPPGSPYRRCESACRETKDVCLLTVALSAARIQKCCRLIPYTGLFVSSDPDDSATHAEQYSTHNGYDQHPEDGFQHRKTKDYASYDANGDR